MIVNTFDDGVIVESIVDNGDGTGTHTDYTTDPPTVVQLVDLPIPEPEPVDVNQLMVMVLLALSEDASVSQTTRDWAMAWRVATFGVTE